MASVDASNYVDLTLLDRTPQAVFDAAVAVLALRLPGLRLLEGDLETVLLEAFSEQMSEVITALNRLPSATFEGVLRLLQVVRDIGTNPTLPVRFAVNTPTTIPAGFRLRFTPTDGTAPVDLQTAAAAVATGATVDVTVTALIAGAYLNGTTPTAGTVSTVDSLPSVDSASATGPFTAGTDVESDAAYLSRGANKLSRLTATLIRPSDFTAAALDDTTISRAFTIDLLDAGWLPPTAPVATPSTTGGTLPAGAYSYVLTTITATGETLQSTAAQATTTGATSSVALTWTAPATPQSTAATTGTRIYRALGAGGYGLIGSASVGATTFADTNATAPGVAPPTSNTTVTANAPGHVSVAVSATGGAVLTTAAKTATQTRLSALAASFLAIHIIDPTITTVNVTASLKRLPGFTDAQVIASATTALTGYLNPDTWDYSTIVRQNDIIGLLDRVDGVAVPLTVTLGPGPDGTGNVTLTGYAPLTRLGTVTLSTS